MSQESEQAQEAWIESATKFSPPGLGSVSYIAGMCNYKAALKAEIPNEIEDILKSQLGGETFFSDADVKAVTAALLSLLDTVKPL